MYTHAERSMVTSSSSLDLSGSMRPPEDSTDEEEVLEPDAVLNHEPEQVAASVEQAARESKHRTVTVDIDAVHSMVPRPPPFHFPGASYQARLTRARSAKRSSERHSLENSPGSPCASAQPSAGKCPIEDMRTFAPTDVVASPEEQTLREALAQLGLGHRADSLAPALLRAGLKPSEPESSNMHSATRKRDDLEINDVDDDNLDVEEDADMARKRVAEMDDTDNDDLDADSDDVVSLRPHVAMAPPPLASNQLTEKDAAELIGELQRELGTSERSIKRLVVEPTGEAAKVKCDVIREANVYRCYLLLQGGHNKKGESGPLALPCAYNPTLLSDCTH